MGTAAVTEDKIASALGAAVREVRGSMSQQALADQLGMWQSTVQRWESGELIPSVPQVMWIEEVLGLEPGNIFVRAGLIQDVATVRQAVVGDEGLSQHSKRMLLDLYALCAESDSKSNVSSNVGARKPRNKRAVAR